MDSCFDFLFIYLFDNGMVIKLMILSPYGCTEVHLTIVVVVYII